MYLSKTKYVQMWSCPKGAWLRQHHPELAPVDASAMARFHTGDEVGNLARGLFGPYVNVTAVKEDGSLNLPRMMENTRFEMAHETPVICEAAFSYGGLYCAVDLLRKDGDGWSIYEVKSSSDGEQDKYIADVSYQLYVLEHCGVKVTGVFLICIDTSYVLEETGLDLAGFFKITDLRAQAEAAQETVREVLHTAEQVLSSDTEPVMEWRVSINQ